jgi:hypothetical protein
MGGTANDTFMFVCGVVRKNRPNLKLARTAKRGTLAFVRLGLGGKRVLEGEGGSEVPVPPKQSTRHSHSTPAP